MNVQSLVHDTQKDVNKKGTTDNKEKKQHNTINTKAQRSSPRGQTTSRNPNFALFAPIFLIFFFLIMYDLNRKHTIFSSIGQKVWPREIPQFSARNLKHHLGSELGALEVKFWPLPMGKPD
jgi:hypothetical protein